MNRRGAVHYLSFIVLLLSITIVGPGMTRAEYIDGETIVQAADPDYGLTRMITIPSGLCGVLVGWVGIYEDMYSSSVSNSMQGLTWNGDNLWAPAPELFSGTYCKTVLSGMARDGSGGAFGVGIGTTSVMGVNCMRLVHITAAGDEVEFDIFGTSASGAVFDPGVVFDGSGGAIVSWRECPEGEDYHVIKAQRADDSGDPLWSGGAELCYGEGYCYTPMIVEDGAGGCIVAWIDYRSGRSLYAQRVNFAGLPMWTTNGV
ncbi:MAG TPA: hypothetical protein VLA34_02015, partial [Candidatus Krumholzibacterium sp.]|nr:hypothetical protein [Candidatus Krumholzibacterium sp.]